MIIMDIHIHIQGESSRHIVKGCHHGGSSRGGGVQGPHQGEIAERSGKFN